MSYEKHRNPYGAALAVLVGIIAVFFGISNSTAEETPPKKTGAELAGMVAPFVDEDTVFVGHFDLSKISGLPRLLGLLEKIGGIEGMPPQAAENMNNIAKAAESLGDLEAARVFYADRIEPLLESGITDFFFLFNVKDFHFGIYCVVPNIDTDAKALIVEKAFMAGERNSQWGVRAGNHVVIIGGDSLMEMCAAMLSLSPVIPNEYLFLSNEEKKKAIINRFTEFRARENPLLVEAFDAVGDCDVFKVAILFPDSFTAMELSVMKKMKAPINEYSFSFLKERRRYAALGIDTKKPALVFTTKSTSPEMAEEYAEFIDLFWRKIIANYLSLSYMYAGGEANFQSYNGLTYEQMYELIAALLPEADGSDVRTIIDADFIETEGPGILKNMFEAKVVPMKDRPFSPEGNFKNPTFYLNEKQ